MVLNATAIIIAYLLGSISGSLLLGRFRNVDIRQHGSGNAGGTNAFRTLGFRFALGVIVIDIGKGAFATFIPDFMNILQPDINLAAACGFAAIVGHCYPIWHKFNGGKGAGTLIGVLLVLAPAYLLTALLAWVLVLLISGYVGLATILAVLALIPVNMADESSALALRLLILSAAILILFTHRENLLRLYKGTENRFEKVRIKNWFKTSN